MCGQHVCGQPVSGQPVCGQPVCDWKACTTNRLYSDMGFMRYFYLLVSWSVGV